MPASDNLEEEKSQEERLKGIQRRDVLKVKSCCKVLLQEISVRFISFITEDNNIEEVEELEELRDML